MHRVAERTGSLAGRGRAGRVRSAETSGERPGGRREAGAPVRTRLVERTRREIASGTYDTPGRLDLAAERLLDRLGFPGR
jgi:hypothetical protein